MPSRLRPRESAMVCRATRRTRSPEAEACDRRPLHALACTKTLATSRETIHRIHEIVWRAIDARLPQSPGLAAPGSLARRQPSRPPIVRDPGPRAAARPEPLAVCTGAPNTGRALQRSQATHGLSAVRCRLALTGSARPRRRRGRFEPPTRRPARASLARPALVTAPRAAPDPSRRSRLPHMGGQSSLASTPSGSLCALAGPSSCVCCRRCLSGQLSRARARALQVPRCRGATETSRPWSS